MARMYSHRKGKSGSKKPVKKIAAWVRYTDKEVEKLIVKLAKGGKTTSEIGIALRDSYGINSVKAVLNNTISSVLKANNLQKDIPEDLTNFMKQLIAVKKHAEKNHHDMTAIRGIMLTTSKMMRLIKYYKRSGRLPKDWKFDPERIKMYVE